MTSSMRSLRFGVISSQEVLDSSVLEIKKTTDLLSFKLGSTRDTLCKTCGQAHGVCQGHFGHITLPFPVVHPLHKKTAETIHRFTCAVCNARITGGRCVQCGNTWKRYDSIEQALVHAPKAQWMDHCKHCRPVDLLIHHLPVPPPIIRPNNDVYHSALTSLLSGILKACTRFARVLSQGGTDSAIHSSKIMIHRRVKDYFLNPTDSRAPGLCSRLKGKEGRMRKNLMGFRVNRAGRCVITPDPLCHPRELRVPPSVCDQLGIQDGEVVLFNRQPSLHRGSLMAHVARRGHSRTFAFSPTVCGPYNADYDGDEMNLHKLSTVDARVEAQLLMGVDSNMVSPATGRQWIKLVQDCALSRFLQGRGDEPMPNTLDSMHEEQVHCIDWICERGFSVGLDDFDFNIQKRGHSDQGAVARTADIILDKLPSHNALVQMVRARSKGSVVNLVQLLSCVGWQTVQGKPSVGPNTHRSSSFVESSYAQGLDADEFWHHASAGREGLIHTAIKTGKTGYCQRKLVKFLEDFVVAYDGTVRSRHDNAIVQFQSTDEPGTPVGIVSAQSIGQPVTQSTLNQFHHAGIENDTNLASLLKLLAPPQSDSKYTWKQVPRAYMLAPIDWRGTCLTRAPTEHELEEAKARGCAVPHPRYIGAVPENAVGWQFAAKIRQACGYAHYSWKTHQVVAASSIVRFREPWCTHAASTSLTETGDMPVHDVAMQQAYCTNAHRMASVYGIEAARAALLKELIAFGSILPKHYELLADAMTYTGAPRSVNRSGMKDMGNIIGHACFETVINTIMEAGRQGRADNMHATSSRLAVGMAPQLGTNSFDIIQHVQQKVKRRSETASFLDQPLAKKKKFILNF